MMKLSASNEKPSYNNAIFEIEPLKIETKVYFDTITNTLGRLF